MRVLIACEESQEVCKAFRALGHEAYSCDIQEPSGGHPEWHILQQIVQKIVQKHFRAFAKAMAEQWGGSTCTDVSDAEFCGAKMDAHDPEKCAYKESNDE